MIVRENGRFCHVAVTGFSAYSQSKAQGMMKLYAAAHTLPTHVSFSAAMPEITEMPISQRLLQKRATPRECLLPCGDEIFKMAFS